MNLYTIWQTAAYKTPTGLEKYLDFPLNAIVESEGEEQNGRVLVTNGKIAAWVDSSKLAPYKEPLPKNNVDMSGVQTPSETDAEQYIIIDGQRIVNACGFICAAYLLQKPILEIFQVWKSNYLSHYKTVKNQNWLTSEFDIIQVLNAFGVKSKPLRIDRLTPHALESHLGKSIIGVSINGYIGRLSRSGIRHWVVPTEQFIDRFGYGTVDLYNPYPNRIERYSWDEFATSVYRVSGVERI